MNTLSSLFLENDALDDAVEAFCTSDPAWRKAKQQFYETAEEIAKWAGYDLYDAFESSFGTYLKRTCDLYYLFGLGLRQEVLRSLGAEE